MPTQPGPRIEVGPIAIGGGAPLACILGPCVIESEGQAVDLARGILAVAAAMRIPWIFKGSFDKANRSAAGAARGVGIEAGLRILARVRDELGVPVTTDVHAVDQVARVAAVVDLLQVPAFLCRQTDLLIACAASGKPVNVKRGQFVAPADADGILSKLAGAPAMLTERGTTFGHGDLVDFRGLEQMRSMGVPVCFDATHSAQRPGGARDGGPATGGSRAHIPALARAAVAVGVDAIFAEVHEVPERAVSDAATQWPLSQLDGLLRPLLAIDAARRAYPANP